ncbi:Guanine nucleotide-binding protein subunit alpha-12 [Thelohanellus kitauei]|uniref:Guanine nucleotide-binding protein subunit alpha-12 n=1 Tax=Thelohanellus kitauei TaxID=669202 RepID=A0A0C2N001_THEKT|nr:Guanine nucleotide-binding protein subunit alpha-12 [Thelohanellus kitauei]
MVGVIFMVPSSDFDRVIIEDRKTNAVVEALNIFKAIIQSSKLRNCAIVVNFNKVDILVEKIKLKNIDEYLPNFVGDPRNIDDVKNFYINTFSAVVPEYLSPDFFFTNSLDRKNIKNTFNIIKQNVLNFNMKKLLHE